MKTSWPRIRPHRRKRYVNGMPEIKTTYAIDCGKINGKRHVEFRSTIVEAEARAYELRAERKQLGEDAFALTSEQKRDAVLAIRLLNNPAISLSDTVLYWLQNSESLRKETWTCGRVQAELLEAQTKRGLRNDSIKATRTRYSSFLDLFGSRAIDTITGDDVDGWLVQITNDVTRSNAIRYLSVFFNFAVKRGYLSKSPMAQIERPRLKYKVPEFLSVDQVTAIMREAVKSDPGIVGKLALGFFAGIRPEELKRMTQDDVSLENKLVTVRAEVAKCGIPRHVTMSYNLVAWMRYPLDNLNNFDERRKSVCRAVGIEHWPHDAMRHTFATFHLAYGQNADLTAHELGHTQGVRLLFRHYRGLATKSEADRYWKIRP